MRKLLSKIVARCERSYWLAYTLAFIAAAIIILFVYPSNARSIMWNIDGAEQYFPFFIYEGQWLRQIAGSILAGAPQIPMWEPALGYGADMLTTLDVIYDPLNLLSGLCPERFAEYLFQLLVVARLYLAGAAFSAYARHMGCSSYSTLLAALLYAFCGTTAGALQWPGGAWGLILFPWLLLGVEKVLAGERPYVFVLAVAAYFAISCYFAYGACIMLVPYCAARVIVTQRGIGPARFLLWVAKFLGLLAIGVLMAGLALIPTAVGILGGDRATESSVEIALAYSTSYYQELIGGFLSSASVGSDCYIGFGGVAVLALVALFAEKRQHRLLKVAFVLMTVGLMLPIVGSVFNGFNYATNRWVWAYALCVCYIVAKMLPQLLNVTPRLGRALLWSCIAYTAVLFLLPDCRTEQMFASATVMFLMLVVLGMRSLKKRQREWALAICVVAGLMVNMFYIVSPDENGWGKEALPIGSGDYKLHGRSPNSLVASLPNDGTWRYDASATVSTADRTRNASLVLGLPGIDFYNSLYNDNIDLYHTQLGVVGTNINFSYQSLADRPVLDVLNAVKYLLVPKTEVAPYNYDEIVAAEGVAHDIAYTVYQGTKTLPYVYTYHGRADAASYGEMTPLERQQTLMQTAVLDGDAAATATGVPQKQPEFADVTLPYQITDQQNLTVENNVIHVTKEGATMTLSFDGLPEAETYLNFKNLNFTAMSPIDLMGNEAFDSLGLLQKAKVLKDTSDWKAPIRYMVFATSSAGGNMTIDNYANSFHMYGGKSDWLLDMGYAADPQTSITLRFPIVGDYSFDGMDVSALPVTGFDAQVEALEPADLEGGTFGTNSFSCSLTTGDGDLVYFAIPWSEGWKATVDGVPAEIVRANTAFMALALPAGHHDITLEFSTPCLPIAAACSAAGIVLFAALVAFCEIRARRNR